jgi:hypothetical protein
MVSRLLITHAPITVPVIPLRILVKSSTESGPCRPVTERSDAGCVIINQVDGMRVTPPEFSLLFSFQTFPWCIENSAIQISIISLAAVVIITSLPYRSKTVLVTGRP